MLYYIDESVVMAAKEGDTLVIDRLEKRAMFGNIESSIFQFSARN